MRRVQPKGGKKRVISKALRAIDIWCAILLLTGQVTVGGVFLSSGGIWFSFTGPIFGGERSTGTSPGTNVVFDGIDILTALLLIYGQLTNTGPWISSGHFNFVVTGPIFGVTAVPVAADPKETSPRAQALFNGLCQEIVERELTKFRKR